MKQRCFICNNQVGDLEQRPNDDWSSRYHCPCCGFVWLSQKSVDFVLSDNRISEKEKSIISICLREIHEKQGQEGVQNALSLDDIQDMIEKYQPLDFLNKIEKFLLVLEENSKSPGAFVTLNMAADFSLYHCHSIYELISLLGFIYREGLIDTGEGESLGKILDRGITQDTFGDEYPIILTTKGLHQLKEMSRTDKTDLFMAQAVSQVNGLKIESENLAALLKESKGETKKALAEIDSIRESRDKALNETKKFQIKEECARREREKVEQENKEAIVAKRAALEMVKIAQTERDNAQATVKTTRAEIKKARILAEIALTRAEIAQEKKKEAMGQARAAKAEKAEAGSQAQRAVKTREKAENEAHTAKLEKERALDQAACALAEKLTAISIAEKEKIERQRSLEKMKTAQADARSAKALARGEVEQKIRALRAEAQALAEAKKARKMAEKAFFTLQKIEQEKKEAQAASRRAQENVMDVEYKMDQALKALHKAELEKKEALKLVYGA